MRRYHRADLLDHHARTLIERPLALLGLAASPDPADEPHGPTLPILLLRFLDLLDLERQSALGRNRVVGHLPAEIGGFYGISENVQPPDAPAVEALLRNLRRDVLTTMEAPPSPLTADVLADIAAALDVRLQSGRWPRDYALPSTGARQNPTLLRRLLNFTPWT
jgi:hypothetical protein